MSASEAIPVQRAPAGIANERREERRRQRAELSRSHVLDAAEEVFGIHGYHDATIRQIAEVAGFSPAAVYGFVKSKEDLVAAIMNRHGEKLVHLHADILARDDSAPNQLKAIVDLQVEYHSAHPNFGRLFQHTIGLSFLSIDSTMDGDSRLRLRESLELLEGLFACGIADGELVPGDPKMLSAVFSSMMQGYLFRILLVQKESPADRAEFQGLVARAFVVNPAVQAASGAGPVDLGQSA